MNTLQARKRNHKRYVRRPGQLAHYPVSRQDYLQWIWGDFSLTRALETVTGVRPGVNGRSTFRRIARPDEQQLLGLQQGATVLERSVQLYTGSILRISACTVFPMQTLKGRGRQFLQLKNRPLGKVIFRAPRALRTLRLHPEQTFPGLPVAYRRASLYYWYNQPLLVIETFHTSQ